MSSVSTQKDAIQGWNAVRQFRPEIRLDDAFVYVGIYNTETGKRESGMHTCWVAYEECKALRYANRLNEANRYPAYEGRAVRMDGK